jgi:hypothetical protein
MEKPTDELRADESPHVAPAWNRNCLVRKNRKRKGKCQRAVSGARTRVKSPIPCPGGGGTTASHRRWRELFCRRRCVGANSWISWTQAAMRLEFCSKWRRRKLLVAGGLGRRPQRALGPGRRLRRALGLKASASSWSDAAALVSYWSGAAASASSWSGMAPGRHIMDSWYDCITDFSWSCSIAVASHTCVLVQYE